jgi:membrane-associated phospholipid phosphatase
MLVPCVRPPSAFSKQLGTVGPGIELPWSLVDSGPGVVRTCRRRHLKCRSVVIPILCMAFLVCAQTIAASDVVPAHVGRHLGGWQRSEGPSLGRTYLKGYLTDARNVVALGFSPRPAAAWLKFSLVIGATLRLAEDDQEIQTWIQGKRTGCTDRIAHIGRFFGDGRYALPALGLLYLYGRLSGQDRARQTALLSLESVAVSGGITGTLKYLCHKQRPSLDGPEDIPWSGPGLSASHVSFPSGHSACAFAIGTIVASEYGDRPFVRLLAYGAAALCAFSRLNDNAHYLSDVIVGSAIGHFSAETVLSRYSGSHPSRLSVEPHISDRGTGLCLSYRFGAG